MTKTLREAPVSRPPDPVRPGGHLFKILLVAVALAVAFSGLGICLATKEASPQVVSLAAISAALIALLGGSQIYLQTQLRDTQEKLRIAEQQYASVLNFNSSDFEGKADLIELTLNLMNQGVAVVRPDGRFWLYNKRALEYAGIEDPPFPCTSKDIFEMQLRNKEFGENGELLPTSVREFLLEGKGKPPKSYIRRRPKGTILEIRSDPMPDGGVIQTYTDVTELAEARDAAEAAARAKAAFLATMSHEIRTPLNGVIGAAQLVSKTPLSQEQEKYLETISSCAESLLVVINDILEFSKFESSAVVLENAPCTPAKIFRSALLVVKSAAEAKGLTIRIVGLDQLPRSILTDAKRVQQILINYLGNAVKFTESGSVTLRAEVRSGPQGRKLRGTVIDSGIGIAPEAQGRLFSEFAQVDASISRRFGGTGLGLAICKKLAEALGGGVGVTSRAGIGSEFWFEIPLVETDSHVPEAPRPAMPMTTPKRILIAEDIITNQIVIKGMLESLGHSVAIADNGLEALEKLRADTFDLVFLDMQMPFMDGLEAARQIKADPAWADLPLIAMTANAFESDRQACLDAGMQDFLTKPVRADQLRQVIARALAAGAPEAEASAEDMAQALDGNRCGTLLQFIKPHEFADILDAFELEAAEHLALLARRAADGDVAATVSEAKWLLTGLLELGFRRAASRCNGWLSQDPPDLADIATLAPAIEQDIRQAILAGRQLTGVE